MRHFFYLLLFVLPVLLSAQGKPCCYPYLNNGDSLYQMGVRDKNVSKLQSALRVYKDGLSSSCCTNPDKLAINKDDCHILELKIKETQKEIEKYPKKNVDKSNKNKDGEQESPIPSNPEIDEQLWNKVKKSIDPAYIQSEYLDKCKQETNCAYSKQALARIDTLNNLISIDLNKWKFVENTNDPNKIDSEYLKYCDPPYCGPICICLYKRKALDKKTDLINQIKRDELHWLSFIKSEDLDSIQKYLDSCRWPCRYKNDAKDKINALIIKSKPEMIEVPGGSFEMGNTFEKEKSREKKDETPHPAQVANFYIGIKEVKFKEYDAFCSETHYPKPQDESWGRGDRPVINISWFDAINYCNWRSKKDGFTEVYKIDEYNVVTRNPDANGYRLPTEAEWEYAARGRGKDVKFGNGHNLITKETVNYDVGLINIETDKARLRTLPTGSLKNKNQAGLYDMSGNVMEWCWDWYHADYYDSFSSRNPARNVSGPLLGTTKVIRGGAYSYREKRCTVFHRNFFSPEIKQTSIGFRVARNK